MIETPVFPLKTVLFPNGYLPLRIFEPRYLDMVSACTKNNTGFAVCLISQGDEVGSGAKIHRIGTYAKIVDFEPLANGMLSIMAKGERKIEVHSSWSEKNGLMHANIDYLNAEVSEALAEEHQGLVNVLKEIMSHPSYQDYQQPVHLEDAREVGYRLAEMLPISLLQQQQLLEMDQPRKRLSKIVSLLGGLEDSFLA